MEIQTASWMGGSSRKRTERDFRKVGSLSNTRNDGNRHELELIRLPLRVVQPHAGSHHHGGLVDFLSRVGEPRITDTDIFELLNPDERDVTVEFLLIRLGLRTVFLRNKDRGHVFWDDVLLLSVGLMKDDGDAAYGLSKVDHTVGSGDDPSGLQECAWVCDWPVWW